MQASIDAIVYITELQPINVFRSIKIRMLINLKIFYNVLSYFFIKYFINSLEKVTGLDYLCQNKT